MQCFRVAVLAGLSSLAPTGFALDPTALPTGGQVAAGSAVISQPSAQSLRIDQGSQNAILNWQSFSIGAGNSVDFRQPSASAVALNRVLGNNASEIFGSLTANGQLFLVNPNGVLFGRTAQVDVGGIAASTLGIRDSDFMSSRYAFTNGGGAGSVANAGTIMALSGYAALIGPQVSNTGVINARMGTAALAAGDKATLDMVGDGLISVRVDQAALNASAINKGTITADGGNVLMTARSANALLDTVLSNEGAIRANALTERGGTIYLDGGSRGVTSVSGMLEASGLGAAQKGGSVTVLGGKVGLFGNAMVNVSGDAGGGTALIGGNWQGKGPEANATMTVIGTNATIRADAMTKGGGGKVVVWSDDSTVFAGTLQARGGAIGGNGGVAEVSGKRALEFIPKRIDLKAPSGLPGTLLLDPLDIIVATGGGAAYADVSSFASQSGTVQTIDPATLEAAGATVNLQADRDITVSSQISLTTPGAGLVARAGNDINLNAPIYTNGGPITLGARDPSGLQTAGGTVRIASDIVPRPGAAIEITNHASSNPIYLRGYVSSEASPITFHDKVMLTGIAIVEAETLKFLDTIDGAYPLWVAANGTGVFAGDIGSSIPLASFSITLAGSSTFRNVTTTGYQGYGFANTLNGTYTTSSGEFFTPVHTTLAGPTTISAGTTTVKVFAVDGGFPLVVNSSGPITIVDAIGAITPLASLSIGGGGTTTLNDSWSAPNTGASVTTTGAQTYFNKLVLGTPTSLKTTGGGDVTFRGAVDGAYSLTINGTGINTFDAGAGGSTPLGSLTVASGVMTSMRDVITTGPQDYAGSLTLNGNYRTTNAAFTSGGPASLAGDSSVSTGNGNATFLGAVNGPGTLTINSSGTTTLGGRVGDSVALAALSTDAGGTTLLNGGGVKTVGSQTFADNVLIGAAATLNSTGGGALNLGGTVDGGYALAMNTAGSVVLGAAAGGTIPLASLSVGPGPASLKSVTTAGPQNYSGNVSLGGRYQTSNSRFSVGGATTLTGATSIFTGTGGAEFTGPVDGPVPLAIDSPGGSVVFNANVGSTTPLASIAVKAATIFAHDVTTTGDQTWDGDVTFSSTETTNGRSFRVTGRTTLGGATTINAGGGNVTLSGPVDGPQGLTVNSNGVTTFGSTIGAGVPVAFLTLDSGGSTYVGGNVTTIGPQSFKDPVSGASGLQLASLGGGSILLNQASSTFPAVLATAGSVVLSGQASLGTPANPLVFTVAPSSLQVIQPISLVISSPSEMNVLGSASGVSITNVLSQLPAPESPALPVPESPASGGSIPKVPPQLPVPESPAAGVSIPIVSPQLPVPASSAIAVTSLDSLHIVVPDSAPETFEGLIEVSGQIAVEPEMAEESEKRNSAASRSD